MKEKSTCISHRLKAFLCFAARGHAPNPTPGNLQQNNIRRGTCIHCQQLGHASSNCPSQFSASRHAQFNGMRPQTGTTTTTTTTTVI